MTTAIEGTDLQHRYAYINGIRMHYVEAGAGELVVLLHGFPEFWYSWRHQIRALAAHCRVIAPDLRGYNETENAPPYDIETLEADVIALIRHAGEESAHIVGHDWGGAVAWMLAIRHPERVRSLVVCNLPHPAVFQRAVRRPRQLLRSWYMVFFQLPWLPERVLAAGRYHRLARKMIRECRPGTFTREDVNAYLEAWRRQGLGGGINWYRALARRRPQLPNPVPLVVAPTTLIWGDADAYLGKELTEGTERHVADLTVHHLPGVSHWVQQEAPAEVNTYLLQHLERVGALA
ncbi:MAG: alpha/beta hydrolase [Chloroflexi bacterium]|nr:alpha/beta hydrolase [Chloroflexota bacterium]PWB43186.1 MAG: epoxide hydrolase [Dehalococcoidia bacterium]